MAYVEVDPETGIVEILDYVAVDDAGTIINPLLAAGQIHGVVQGIAQALYEEVSYDLDTGQLMTGSLLDYAVPRAEHVPNIRSSFQETPSPTDPIGVKGIGESGSIAALPCMVIGVTGVTGATGATGRAFPADAASASLIGKSLSSQTVGAAALLASEQANACRTTTRRRTTQTSCQDRGSQSVSVTRSSLTLSCVSSYVIEISL